jgi:hypothetical protein
MADYRDVKIFASERDAELAKSEDKFAPKWWQSEDEDERAKSLVGMATSLKENANERHQANLRHVRMFENVEIDTLGAGDFASSIVTQALRNRGLVRMNVVAACEDTLAAKVAKNKPRASFLTSGGSWDKQRKARRLDKFGRGLLYELNAYEKGKEIFFDACTFGTGLGYLYPNEATGRLDLERVLPDEVYVDELDALYCEPRTLFRRKIVQREVLLAKFPDKAGSLYTAATPPNMPQKNFLTPTVEVWEAWHLPSGPKKKDGMHCICIAGAELFCEPWKLDVFPFVQLRYKKRTVGFWGKGVAETLTGIQIELNRTILSVSEQLRRKGKGRTFVPMGSKVAPAHFTNNIGDLVYYTGNVPPHPDNQNTVAPEELQHIERLYRMAFQEVGLSELSVAAKKPSGLDAAVALREYSDIESERFALVHQAWETFFLDMVKLSLKLIRAQYGSKGYQVRLPNRQFAIEMDWKDIELEEDDYVLQVFPVSSLPQTPAARYQKVKEMQADGTVDKATANRLLDFPDLESETNLTNAAIDDVDATISMVLDEDKPVLMPVEPFQNLDLMVTRATAAYLYARHHGCDDERLGMLQQLIEQASQAKVALMTPPPAPPMMAGPPPGATPMAGPPPGPGGMMPPSIGSNVGNLTVNAQAPVAPSIPPVVNG